MCWFPNQKWPPRPAASSTSCTQPVDYEHNLYPPVLMSPSLHTSTAHLICPYPAIKKYILQLNSDDEINCGSRNMRNTNTKMATYVS